MPIDVPRGCDSRPIDLRMPVEQTIGKASRGFRDDLQCADYGVNCLPVGPESRKVELVDKPMDGVDVINDVGRRWVGFLEGINCVVQDARPEQRL